MRQLEKVLLEQEFGGKVMANSISTIKGLEQGRAKFAYECAVAGSKIKKDKEYKSYVKKIPMLIKTNGLGETFAFVKSRKDSNENKVGYAYQLIYTQTAEWLMKDEKKLININEKDDLIDKIISLDSISYRTVTIETIAFFHG